MDCPDLPTTINIGGDLIYLGDTTTSMNLAYKGRDYFKSVFKPEPGDECILRKYMYLSIGPKDPMVFTGQTAVKDKQRLKAILTARRLTLLRSINMDSNTIVKNNLTRLLRGINASLMELDGSGVKEDEEPYKECDGEKALLDKMKGNDNEVAEMLLQVTWYLMNPDGIPNELQCDWAKMVKKMKEHTTFADVKSALALPNSTKKPLNYFKRIDLKEFGKEQKHKTALEKAKSTMMVEPSEDVMKNRLKQIMTLLALKKYVKGSEPSEENIKKIADALPSKLVDIGFPLQAAFSPMKKFLKQMYDPVYTLLEERTDKTSESLMATLLILLHICNTLPKGKDTYGVYKITGVPPDGLKWVTNQLYNPSSDAESKKKHAKLMYYLSKLTLPIFTDTSTGDLQTIGTSINTTPYFQFGIMGTNLELKNPLPDSIRSADIDILFPTNTLFMFVTESRGMDSFSSINKDIPANFWSIDYRSVDPTSANLTIEAITSPPLSKDSKVDQFIDIKDDLACNHSNLVLSIFFLLDSRLASKKPDETATAPKASKTATTAPKASSNATVPTTATEK